VRAHDVGERGAGLGEGRRDVVETLRGLGLDGGRERLGGVVVAGEGGGELVVVVVVVEKGGGGGGGEGWKVWGYTGAYPVVPATKTQSLSMTTARE
jgi:hypothetical protein